LLLAGSTKHYLVLLLIKYSSADINKNGDIHDIAIIFRFDLVLD